MRVAIFVETSQNLSKLKFGQSFYHICGLDKLKLLQNCNLGRIFITLYKTSRWLPLPFQAANQGLKYPLSAIRSLEIIMSFNVFNCKEKGSILTILYRIPQRALRVLNLHPEKGCSILDNGLMVLSNWNFSLYILKWTVSNTYTVFSTDI